MSPMTSSDAETDSKHLVIISITITIIRITILMIRIPIISITVLLLYKSEAHQVCRTVLRKLCLRPNRDRDPWGMGTLCARVLCGPGGKDCATHWRCSGFLKQRLDMAIQRGNAAAVVGTLAEGNALQD